MNKRRQPPSPAVEPVSTGSSEIKEAKNPDPKRKDQRPSPAYNLQTGIPKDGVSTSTATSLTDNQKSFLANYQKQQAAQQVPGMTASGVPTTLVGAIPTPGTEVKKKASGGRWSKEEDDKLRAGVATIGAKNWKRIAQEFLLGERSDVQCLHRWQKVLRPGLVKGNWTEDEDQMVIKCIKAGITKWSEIADRIPGRIGELTNQGITYLP
jgi:hypothetical protein